MIRIHPVRSDLGFHPAALWRSVGTRPASANNLTALISSRSKTTAVDGEFSSPIGPQKNETTQSEQCSDSNIEQSAQSMMVDSRFETSGLETARIGMLLIDLVGGVSAGKMSMAQECQRGEARFDRIRPRHTPISRTTSSPMES